MGLVLILLIQVQLKVQMKACENRVKKTEQWIKMEKRSTNTAEGNRRPGLTAEHFRVISWRGSFFFCLIWHLMGPSMNNSNLNLECPIICNHSRVQGRTPLAIWESVLLHPRFSARWNQLLLSTSQTTAKLTQSRVRGRPFICNFNVQSAGTWLTNSVLESNDMQTPT